MTNDLCRMSTAVGLVLCLALAAACSPSKKAVPSTTTSIPKKSLAVSPNSGLVNMQSVKVTGEGFAASSDGNILECNGDPNQPTVALPAPVSSTVSVGCSAPSISGLTVTSSSGLLSTSYKVVEGTVGPPCGTSDALTECPAADSSGLSPATDAAAYPCPPTPAQQAAGIVCVLTFGDAAGDTASAPISFASENS